MSKNSKFIIDPTASRLSLFALLWMPFAIIPHIGNATGIAVISIFWLLLLCGLYYVVVDAISRHTAIATRRRNRVLIATAAMSVVFFVACRIIDNVYTVPVLTIAAIYITRSLTNYMCADKQQ